MAGIFLQRIQPTVQFGDVLRGQANRRCFRCNGIPQVLDELNLLGNRELFQVFKGRFHSAIRKLDVSGEQIFSKMAAAWKTA